VERARAGVARQARGCYAESNGFTPCLPEVAVGRGNGTGNLLVVLLWLFLNAAVLRWRAQGQRFQAGEGGDHGEKAGGLVHVQAHGDAALLRRVARQAGLKKTAGSVVPAIPCRQA
jgi:hypothetical protein